MNSGNAYDCAHHRQYRHDALLAWKVPAIVAALPVLIHITITLFLVGLVILLWSQINSSTAYIVLVITVLMILVYSITTLLPLFYEACPYKNMVLLLFLKMTVPLISKLKEAVIITYKKSVYSIMKVCMNKPKDWNEWIGSYQDSIHDKNPDIYHERNIIHNMSSELTWKSIIWLLKYSQNHTAIDVTLRSIDDLALMPKMIDSLFKVNITGLLSIKLSALLPDDLDDEFWRETLFFRLMNSVSDLSPYLQGSFHLWKLVYLHHNSITTIFKHERSYTQFYGQWLTFWRKLQENKSLTSICNLEESWNTGVFVKIICNEALYYHLHPENQLYIQENVIHDTNPLSDLHILIESYLTQSTIASVHIFDLTSILETIVYILSKNDYDNLILRKKSTFLLLLKLISFLEVKHYKFCALIATSLEIFSLKTQETRYQLLCNYAYDKKLKF